MLNAGPPDRRDFTDDVVTITFEAGGDIVLTGNVPIRDDEIDEANEVFITRLSLADPSSDPGTILIDNDKIVCEIVDNDGESSTIAELEENTERAIKLSLLAPGLTD